jgi:hypothetical protein
VESHSQNLKIALVNKQELVEWGPETQTMWLAESASNPPKMHFLCLAPRPSVWLWYVGRGPPNHISLPSRPITLVKVL